MSSDGVNKKYSKFVISFMATIILIQGAIYLGLSIWGISIHNNCSNKFLTRDSPVDFVVKFIYLWDSMCGSIGVEDANTKETIYNIVIGDFAVAHRTYILFIVYACISGLWIVTSLLIFTALCSAVNKLSYILCFWPWLMSVIAGSVLDVVATGFHIHDIYHTTSASDTLKYLDVSSSDYDTLLKEMSEYDSTFVFPAIIFTCISSRFVIIWCLNIFGVIFSISVAKSVVKQVNVVPYVDKRASSNSPIALEPSLSMHRKTPVQSSISETEVEIEPISQPQMRRERRTLEPLKSPDDESTTNYYNEHNSPEPIIIPGQFERPPSSVSNKRVKELRNQAIVPVPLTPSYVSSESHPENLDYPNNKSVSSEPSELSESPLNQRYSTQDGFPYLSQPHITQELRGQLPWSYFNFREDIEARKQVHSHSYENEEDDLPPIPVPDYTLHPPKKDRQSLSTNSQQSATRW